MKVFVSYTSSDREWAHWIGWQLRAAGHEPFVHDWEIGAGDNIAGWMEQRFKQADKLIGVFSDRYCEAAFSQSERWAAYWKDPRGRTGFFVPIEVCRVNDWPAMVEPLKRLSLVNLDETQASNQLIAFLQPAQSPTEKPAFPGASSIITPGSEPFTEGSEPLDADPPDFPAPAAIESTLVEHSTHIALPATDLDLAIRCIDDSEPEPQIFGRDNEVEVIVSALIEDQTMLVSGGPGMGKTAVATAALYDSRIIARFGRRRIFASLEAATEARAILVKLVEAVGLAPTGDDAILLRILEANAAERPIAAILDNAETVFDVDRGGFERILSLVARIPSLSLVGRLRHESK